MSAVSFICFVLIVNFMCIHGRGGTAKRESDPARCDSYPICPINQFIIDNTDSSNGGVDTWTVVTYVIPPFLFSEPKNNMGDLPDGVLPDVLQGLSKELNVRLAVDSYTTDTATIQQLLDLVEDGTYDLAIGPLLGTLNNRKGITFSKPMIGDLQYALVPSHFDIQGVTTVDDLLDIGLLVGSVQGSVHADWLDNQNHVPGLHVDSIEEGLDWLTNQPWAFVLDGFTARFINNWGDFDTKVVELESDFIVHKVAIRENSSKYDEINNALLRMHEDGRLVEAVNKLNKVYIDPDNN